MKKYSLWFVRTGLWVNYLSGPDQLRTHKVYFKPNIKLSEDRMCAVIDSLMAMISQMIGMTTYMITCFLFVSKLLFRYAILFANLLAAPKCFISCFEWPEVRYGLITASWRICPSVDWDIICSDNEPMRSDCEEVLSEYDIDLKTCIEVSVCKMSDRDCLGLNSLLQID